MNRGEGNEDTPHVQVYLRHSDFTNFSVPQVTAFSHSLRMVCIDIDGAIAMFDSWLVGEGAVVRMLDRRRFPPPWSVEETPACFIVRDRAGQALAHLYYEESDVRFAANLLTKDEARRNAADIAKLP
jgi:hypothetical protein